MDKKIENEMEAGSEIQKTLYNVRGWYWFCFGSARGWKTIVHCSMI